VGLFEFQKNDARSSEALLLHKFSRGIAIDHIFRGKIENGLQKIYIYVPNLINNLSFK
jgi:hypothetical protein